jgi:hypothetical protein
MGTFTHKVEANALIISKIADTKSNIWQASSTGCSAALGM